MIKRPGATHYTPVEWDEAFQLMATELQSLGSPDEAIFYTSGRASNESAFAYQLFVRAFGTNNLPDCSNMCHESTSVALAESIGIGKASVSIEDVYDAKLIIIAGQNPGTNHPRMLSALEIAKKNGAKIVSINPLREAGLVRFKNPQEPKGLVGKGTEISDLHLPIKINGDLALFQALGFAAGAMGRTRPRLHRQVHHRIRRSGRRTSALSIGMWSPRPPGSAASRSPSSASCCATRTRPCSAGQWGLTQHRNAVATIKEVCNLAFAQGNIGKHGAGLFPVRGHSNVQGDRTMGIWERPPAHFLDALQKEFGFDPPRPHGLDTVDSIRAMRDGKAHFFLGLGGNFVQAASDTDVIVEAMHKTRMTVHISTKLNRSHLVCGETALILPTKGRTEKDIQASGPQWISVEDSTCSVHSSRGPLEPASPHLMSEVEIICRLAEATIGDRYGIAWKEMRQDYSVIRTHISKVVPGCESYEVNVHRPGGFVMPHPPRDTRTFETKSGKAEFVASPIEVLQVPEGHLVLQTLRSHDQFNTTIYGLSDRYRGIEGGRKVIFLHSDDIKQLGFANGDFVDIITHWTEDDRERIVRDFRIVEYDTPRGSAAAYYPETNPLIPLDSTALSSNTPTSKSIIVKLLAVGAGESTGPAAPGGEASDQTAQGQEGQDAAGSDWSHKSDPQPHHLS